MNGTQPFVRLVWLVRVGFGSEKREEGKVHQRKKKTFSLLLLHLLAVLLVC